ncbi:TadG family pilus assembly protein [Pigmentiphaga soli]|uniref:TadG family pilus assembly protein n=1 Tax=Pigmentiphaga soli TaxID=1007095 RepID=A0ABP8H537_9BURK
MSHERSRRSSRRPPGRAGQRGTVLIAAAAALLACAALLGAADLGYLFYMKREYQKAADLAALAGAQVLPKDAAGACPPETSNAALDSIKANLGPADATIDGQQLSVQCKRWDPSGETIVAPDPMLEGDRRSGAKMYFGASKGAANNAVRVTIRRTMPGLLPLTGDTVIAADAVATREDPVAAFSIGSRLVRLNPEGLLYDLLSTIGLGKAQIDALSAAGLAKVNVTPAGLLSALNLPTTAILDVGTADEAAQLKDLRLGGLLDITADALSATKGAEVQAEALRTLKGQLSLLGAANPLDLPVRLFGTESQPGVFAQVQAPNELAAMKADVNVLDLIGTSLSLANGENLVNIPDSTVVGLVDARLRVIEPPTIAIGGKGTSANSAQVRLYIRLHSDTMPVVGTLLNVLGTKIDLPILIEVAQSKGTLENMCAPGLAPRQADISVQSSVAKLCVGKFPHMDDTEGFFSPSNSCDEIVDRYPILTVLGLPLKSWVPPLTVFGSSPDMVRVTAPKFGEEPETVTVSPDDNIDLADLVENVAEVIIGAIGDGLLNDLLGNRSASGLANAGNGAARTSLAKALLGTSNTASAVQGELTRLGQQLSGFGSEGGSGGLAALVSGLVNGLLDTVGDALSGLLCVLGGDQCRVEHMLQGDSAIAAVLGMAVHALEPVLDSLSTVLQSIINKTLGLGIGQTDVSALSVNCGAPRLVY